MHRVGMALIVVIQDRVIDMQGLGGFLAIEAQMHVGIASSHHKERDCDDPQ
jgi:hypothetical protein